MGGGGGTTPAPIPTPEEAPEEEVKAEEPQKEIEKIGDAEIKQGVTKQLKKREKIKFIMLEEEHTLEILEMTKDSITVVIYPHPITITLKMGEGKKIDINEDGYYNLYIRLENIDDEKGYLTMRSLYEKIIIEEEEEIEKQSPATKKSAYLAWALVILIASLAVYAYIKYKPKEELFYQKQKDIWKKEYKINWKPIINIFLLILVLSGLGAGAYFGFSFFKYKIAQSEAISTSKPDVIEPEIAEEPIITERKVEMPSPSSYSVVNDPLFRNMFFVGFIVIMIIILVRGINLRGTISFGKEPSSSAKKEVIIKPSVKQEEIVFKEPHRKPALNLKKPKFSDKKYSISSSEQSQSEFKRKSRKPKEDMEKKHQKTKEDEIKALESFGFKVIKNNGGKIQENKNYIKIKPQEIEKDISKKNIKSVYNIIEDKEKLPKKEEPIIQKEMSKRGKMLNELKGVFNG